jgi:hypothetical protein
MSALRRELSPVYSGSVQLDMSALSRVPYTLDWDNSFLPSGGANFCWLPVKTRRAYAFYSLRSRGVITSGRMYFFPLFCQEGFCSFGCVKKWQMRFSTLDQWAFWGAVSLTALDVSRILQRLWRNKPFLEYPDPFSVFLWTSSVHIRRRLGLNLCLCRQNISVNTIMHPPYLLTFIFVLLWTSSVHNMVAIGSKSHCRQIMHPSFLVFDFVLFSFFFEQSACIYGGDGV